jgi:hypothetical protein
LAAYWKFYVLARDISLWAFTEAFNPVIFYVARSGQFPGNPAFPVSTSGYPAIENKSVSKFPESGLDRLTFY